MVSATDGSAFTGSVTVSVTGDAGTQATGSVGSGACTHEGNGYHTYAPAQAETNYDLIAFTFTGTGAVPATVQIYPLPTTGILAPTVINRTLDVSAGGEAGVDWANVGSPTTSLALTGTTIATTQKVDVETIKTNAVVNGGTVTFPTNATIASTTNITAGTITTVTTVTNQLTAAAIATGVWQDSTAGDFTTASSIGKALYIANIAPGASGGHMISGSNAGTTTFGAFTVTGATTLTGAVSLGSTLGVTGAITATNASNNLTLGTFTVTTNAIAWPAAWDAEVQSEVQDAIEANHLDHLLAADYDPASKPGTATALLNELIGSDAGVSQFTANALELAPTGGSAPTAAQIRAEIDANSTQLAAIVADTNELQTDWANGGRLDLILDARASQTSVDTIDDFLDTEIAAIKAKTDNLPAAPAATGDIPSAATIATAVLTTQMTESYRGTGAAPTLAQASFELIAQMGERSISGTTLTLKKLDGSTTAKTYTLNDGTTPTAITETT